MRIKDIAAEAGVSPATVSRVLNGRFNTMTPETRHRVEEVIQRTGYQPSSAARSLRGGRTGSLGVVLADMKNPYSAAILEALSTSAFERNLMLLVTMSSNDPALEIEAIDRLIAANVDGLIVNTCQGEGAAEHLREAARKKPMVLLDRPVPGAGLALVTSNNTRLTEEIVEALAQGGCTSCYLLNEPGAVSVPRQERIEAFRASVVARGMSGRVLELVPGREQALDQLQELVELGPCPVGLIAANGKVLLQTIDALGTSGFSVPHDVEIAAFDEYPWNRVVFGGITTAVQDIESIAQAALDLMEVCVSERGQGEKIPPAPEPVVIPGQVVVRASTRKWDREA